MGTQRIMAFGQLLRSGRTISEKVPKYRDFLTHVHKKTPSVMGAFLSIIQRGGVKRVLSEKRSPKRFPIKKQTLPATCMSTSNAVRVTNIKI